ncbi:MAG: tetratricopeptide repeat domain with UbiE methylase [Blastococcus sp.]|nr:tetratricopeptide repeat domain with UbiE methylase [Blastococcus sp.]
MSRAIQTLRTVRTAIYRLPWFLNPVQVPRQLRARRRLRNADQPLHLHLGCGKRRMRGYINIDQHASGATDYVGDILELPVAPETVERIETYHVIEHLPHRLAPVAVERWHQWLEPGGVLVMECPDFDQGVRDYLDGAEERIFSIYGHQRFDGDAHLFGYNEARLVKLCTDAGFRKAEIVPPQDYHAASEPCLRIEATK